MIFILEDNEDRIEHFKLALGNLECHFERTVPEAINWLSEHMASVMLCSLDNDLYVPGFQGDEGEGWQLCEWILANMQKVPIIVHSTNDHASVKMEFACSDAGWPFQRIVPYDSFEWIGEIWIETIKETLS
ncbi:MAG: hypothetical protein JXM70_15045 [Pirellulales bacterium]|nr:hypothetical protein [Pirellulales bacterium]